MKLAAIIVFLLIVNTANKACAVPKSFSSFLANEPRITAIIYENRAVFQNLLNKRYVYTIPADGSYLLQNGQQITIKNGSISAQKTVKYNQLFELGFGEDVFFNQEDVDCNKIKFDVILKMMAMDCNIPFHTYQLVPIYPEFIRLIVTQKDSLQATRSCEVITENIDRLVTIEQKTDDAIIQEEMLKNKQSMDSLTNEEKDKLKEAIRQIKKLKPWEFGINKREIILGKDINQTSLSGNLMAYYVTYFNDVGCVPYLKLKLASYKEYNQYKNIFMDNYPVASEFLENDDKLMLLLELAGSDVTYYNPEIAKEWREDMAQYMLKDAKIVAR